MQKTSNCQTEEDGEGDEEEEEEGKEEEEEGQEEEEKKRRKKLMTRRKRLKKGKNYSFKTFTSRTVLLTFRVATMIGIITT